LVARHRHLVDERWVPDTDERSNARLVESLLLRHNAADAQFVPLYTEAATPEAGIAQVRTRIGIDETCRSMSSCLAWATMATPLRFFPAAIIWPKRSIWTATAEVLPMRAPNAGEPRITFTLCRLAETESLYLLVAGTSATAGRCAGLSAG
jgi:6-phosphogluconolactonase